MRMEQPSVCAQKQCVQPDDFFILTEAVKHSQRTDVTLLGLTFSAGERHRT